MLRNFDERTPHIGSYVQKTGTLTFGPFSNTVQTGVEGSIDSKGNPKPYTDGGYFSLVKRTHQPALTVKGVWKRSGADWHFSNYPSYGIALPLHATTLTFDTINDVLARSNPSKPIVDVPAFIGELRELPELFYLRGKTLLDKLASGNLSYQFGWKPFIGDLMSLMDFQANLDKRVAYLSGLYQKGGLKFRTQPDESSYSTPWVDASSNIQAWCWSMTKDFALTRRWYSVSWVPEMDLRTSLPSISEIRARAFRSMYGLEVNLSAAWELLPWSWLIDWFSDAGSLLSVQRNSAGFIPGKCWEMTHTVRRRDLRLKIWSSRPDWVQAPVFKDGFIAEEAKSRSKVLATLPTVRVPILSQRQLGILASILWLRK